MTGVYVSLDGEVFNKLDLGDDDKIVMRYISKDLQDLSKVFAPYSLDFSFEASPTNQRNLGFFGSTSVQRINTENKYLCKIYTNEMLSLSGILKVKTGKYKDNKLQSYTSSFGTFMTNLKDIIGSDTFSKLGSAVVDYKASDIQLLLQSGGTSIIDSTPIQYYIPFMSNNRVWSFDAGETNNNDNIYWRSTNTVNTSKFINQRELRPAISFSSIIELIKKKYNLDVISPILNRAEVSNAYVLCNNAIIKNEEFSVFKMRNFAIGNYGYIPNGASDEVGVPLKYNITCAANLYDLTITKNPLASVNYDTKCKFYFKLTNKFGDYNPDTTGRFRLRRKDSDEILYSEDFTSSNGVCVFNILLFDSMFISNQIQFVIETSFDDYVIHNNVNYTLSFNYKFNSNFTYVVYKKGGVNGAGFGYSTNTYTNYNNFKIDLVKLLPSTQIIDFLVSYLKAFNIKVFDTSPSDNRLFWLAPTDINTTRLEYSKATRDYTAYLDSKEFTKEAVDIYNFYNFKHKESSYKSNVDYLIAAGLEYGQTVYPATPPINAKEYKVETAWSIIPPVHVAGSTTMVTTYGFNSEAPSYDSSDDTFDYTPNFDELTVFYKPAIKTEADFFGVVSCNGNGVPTISKIQNYIPALPFNSIGNSLGWSVLVFDSIEYPDTLYLRGYSAEIERLLDQNCLAHNFKLKLPSSEIYLNEETVVQDGGQTPSGFRLQNDIIIGEELFSIVDASIDVTSGDTTIKLLNYTSNG
jgi:hypothetical protein